MNEQALRSELQNDPSAVGYAALLTGGMHDLERVNAAIHAEREDTTLTVPQVPKAKALAFLAGTGILALIFRTAYDNTASTVLQSICLRTWLVLSDASYTVFDLAEPGAVEAIDALVTAGLVTSTQKTAFLALQTVPTSRAIAVCGGAINRNDLVVAMKALGWQVV